MTKTTTPTSGAAIQRYKIGYHSDEWGQRSSTTSGIPDASGPWVRYEDHVTALKAAQPVVTSQPGAAYATLPDESYGSIMGAAYDFRDAHISGSVNLKRSAHAALETAVRNAISASHGQASAQAAPAAVAGPVVNRATVIEWLDANDIEVTDRQMDWLFHFAAPTTQPAPQQEAQKPTAVVVPCHTPSGKRVALYSAKRDLPIGTQLYTAPQPSPAAQGDALDAACQRACMELPEGMSMAIQLERHAGWIELHDSDGEQIELPNADGSLAEQMHEAVNAARAAQEGK